MKIIQSESHWSHLPAGELRSPAAEQLRCPQGAVELHAARRQKLGERAPEVGGCWWTKISREMTNYKICIISINIHQYPSISINIHQISIKYPSNIHQISINIHQISINIHQYPSNIHQILCHCHYN